MHGRTPGRGSGRVAFAALLAAALAAAAARADGTAPVADGVGMPSPGALRAATCVTCHGAARPVSGSQIPRLAGVPADRIERAMRDYAAHAAPGDLMGQIARGYDARTIALIAQWYAGLTPSLSASPALEGGVERGHSFSAVGALNSGGEASAERPEFFTPEAQ